MTPLRGEEISSTKPRWKRVFVCIFISFGCLCCYVFSPGPTQYIFHTPMARCSLFVLKVLLNPKQRNFVVHPEAARASCAGTTGQWRSHEGDWGGRVPPTCPKDRLWDSSRSDGKLVRLVGTPPQVRIPQMRTKIHHFKVK